MEIIGYGGLFLSMGLTVGQLLKDYGQLYTKYTRLDKLSVTTPQLLVDEIEKELSQNLVGNSLSFIRRNQVFIEGVITSNTPIRSVLVKGLDVLYSLFYKKDLYDRREFSKNAYFPMLVPDHLRKEVRMAANLVLKDYEGSSLCDIQRRPNTHIQAALELLQMKASFFKKSMLSNILKFFFDFTKLLLALTYLRLNYLHKKGAVEGTLDIEMGLKMNSLVTVFGDIIYDVRNKKLVMENPLYILKDKEQLLKLVQKKLFQKQVIITLLSIPFIVGGVMFMKKLIEIIQKYIQKKKEDIIHQIRAKMEELAQDKNISDNQKCSICFTNMRNIILRPCRHLCLCYNCLKRIKKNECPICKTEIISSIEIFLK